MKYCSQCGSELISKQKFCSNCGNELQNFNENNDKSLIDKYAENLTTKSNQTVNTVKTELKQSEFVGRAKSNLTTGFFKIIHFFGIIGVIILILQIIASIVLNQETWLAQSFNRAYYTNGIKTINYLNTTYFISYIMPTTIFPFILIALASIKRSQFILIGLILLVILLINI